MVQNKRKEFINAAFNLLAESNKDFAKIKKAVNKKQELLEVGSLDLKRDWGYSKDYTLAMQMILEKKPGEDFVIGSGEATSIKEIVDYVFSYFQLDYKEFVTENTKLLRTGEPNEIVSNLHLSQFNS